MARFVMLVHTDAIPGQESDYHEWYNHQHLQDVLEIPGFVAATRFARAASPEDSASPGGVGHLAIYEIEAADYAEARAILAERAKTMDKSPAVDWSRVNVTGWAQITDRMEAPSRD